ncbi:hypothetical protein E4U60_001362 [Claviceps pazoutovae]|uniref:Diphthine--ammonia ligase n=1 Tax=Claviceps pazoutovae TaxID=1649127 RepID=A0A9P7MCG0_9HYPO|nr:hypothetical protein E4U60_001362 [Claviceps pazoutovae]
MQHNTTQQSIAIGCKFRSQYRSTGSMSAERLNVIALISGGKDSFYSLLHCIRHGHHIVALANLFPAEAGKHGSGDGTGRDAGLRIILPNQKQDELAASCVPNGNNHNEESANKDLNSFMYQTVGHEVISLYAEATGLPLYRQPILGGAVKHERDYDYNSAQSSSSSSSPDETESMLSLLRAVKAHHPEANALCSGAILSTYQRTRVESVALRLGLTPLSYLWKYPILPSGPDVHLADEAQLLQDMADAGLDARIIKVASAGLEEKHLWERVTSEKGVSRIKASLRRFGFTEGATLGEGGEFETLVLDGPDALFQKRICVPDHGRVVVSEGGGSSWLMLRGAYLEGKALAVPRSPDDAVIRIREPALLHPKFQVIANRLSERVLLPRELACSDWSASRVGGNLSAWANYSWDDDDNNNNNKTHTRRSFVADSQALGTSIQCETISVVEKIRAFLSSEGLDPRNVSSVIVLLRDMENFPQINQEYGKLFQRANPPSRITISCGDLLPKGHSIMVHMTIPVANAAKVPNFRNGLHVQSRSYWAPANIGPYSQAIETAITAGGRLTTLRTVHVAGQIPLVPDCMTLPMISTPETTVQQQIVLSLQHLWRIGTEMNVQCWTSAVAYFTRRRQPCESSMRKCALLASQAWHMAHGSPYEDENENENDEDQLNGPDLWDLKHDAQYQSLGNSSSSASTPPPLPDWSIYTLQQQNEAAESCIAPVFSAEIESLPRDSLVEWHAHSGSKCIEAGSVHVLHCGGLEAGRWRGWHCVVRAGDDVVLQTTLAYRQQDATTTAAAAGEKEEEAEDDDGAGSKHADTAVPSAEELREAYRDSLQGLLPRECNPETMNSEPYLVYVDASTTSGQEETWLGRGVSGRLAVVPCYSLWGTAAERLSIVALYERVLARR